MLTRSRQLQLVGLLLFAAANGGCHFAYPGRDPDGPMPCVPADVPRELYKTGHARIHHRTARCIVDRSGQPDSQRRLSLASAGCDYLVTSNTPPEYDLSGQYIIQSNGMIQLVTAGGEVPTGMNLAPIKAANHTTDELQQQILRSFASVLSGRNQPVGVRQHRADGCRSNKSPANIWWRRTAT